MKKIYELTLPSHKDSAENKKQILIECPDKTFFLLSYSSGPSKYFPDLPGKEWYMTKIDDSDDKMKELLLVDGQSKLIAEIK